MHLRNLKIDRPFAVVDLETTGRDPQKDRIVEISVARFEPDGEVIHRTRRLNPTIPIQPGATDAHKITDADVASMPTFRQVARGLFDFLRDCDLGGFNLRRFDIPILKAEFLRADLVLDVEGRRIIDACQIFHQRERRDLTAAYKFYCGKDHHGAHGAGADVTATAEIIDAQLDFYEDLPRDIGGLHEAFHDASYTDSTEKLRATPEGIAFDFGPHSGRTLKDMALSDDRGFLHWVLRKDFSEGVKDHVRAALIEFHWPDSFEE